MSLLHRDRVQTPPPVPQCGSDAYYWVVSDSSQRLSCGPHLPMVMRLMTVLGEHPRTADEVPEAGSRCEYVPSASWLAAQVAVRSEIKSRKGDLS